jgi:hypothetical protein
VNADEAENRAVELAADLERVLAEVRVPAENLAAWFPERLSFLLARDNYDQFLAAVRGEQDIAAGNLARTLFEEAIRWSWVDEDQEARRTAFLGGAAHRHRQVDQAGRNLGIEPDDYYGPLVADVLRAAEGAARFPRQVEGQLEWGLGILSEMLYTEYRLFSQYTHSSLLAAASAAKSANGHLMVGRLPQVARMTIVRNAISNMAVICDGCKAGIVFARPPGSPPLNLLALSVAVEVAELLQPFAPATD